MRPLTLSRAKPALPVLGRSLLGRALAQLSAQGVRRAAVNAHHLSESVRDALDRETPAETAAELFVEPTLMGSGGALAAPREFLGRDERFVLHNGDTLARASLAELAAAAEGERRLGALLVRRGATPGYSGLLVRGGLFVERARADQPIDQPTDEGLERATYLGVSVLRREVLTRVPADRPSDLFPAVLEPFLAEGWSLAVVPYDGPWIEFTTPAQFLDHLVRLVDAGCSALEISLPGGAAQLQMFDRAFAFVAAGASLADGARATGAVVLERDARVAPGARLADVAVLEGAVVSAGAALSRVIVDRGARVPEGAAFENGVVTAGPGGDCAFHPF
jgi:mannose-1-phosphate guanylyltransferase